jgi:acetolactate synthase-1/2/3 large subunit
MRKPVILLGNGIRGNVALIDQLRGLGIPILTTWMGADLIAETDPVYCGRPGTLGGRASNIIQQKATELYVFGARMDGGQTAFNPGGFSPNAEIYYFDVDEAELAKLSDGTRNADQYFFCKDLRTTTTFPTQNIPGNPEWLAWCKALYARFRPELDRSTTEQHNLDPFRFIDWLSSECQNDDILAVGSSGQAAEIFMQTFKVKAGQRMMNCSTLGAMGADIPMAIGAAIAHPDRRVICVTGDGGFMLNMQELEVVRRLKLNIKFFVIANNGYGSIRSMQNNRFNGRHVGCDPKSGMTLPLLWDVARAFRIEYSVFDLNHDYADQIMKPRPEIYQVPVDPNFVQYPRVMSNAQLEPDAMENMTPYLDQIDLAGLMAWGTSDE